MSNENKEPNYYGLIPAPVRYDNNLPPRAIVLYSEITALSNKRGYCYASNGYFAELYSVANNSISRLLSKLEKRGHIEIEITKSKDGTSRKIYPLSKNVNRGTQKGVEGSTKRSRGLNENVEHNNKENNKEIISLREEIENLKNLLKKATEKPKAPKFIPPTFEEITAHFLKKGSTIQEAEKFQLHYQSNGWKVGKNKMKVWAAAATGWIRRNPQSVVTTTPTTTELKSYYLKYKGEKDLRLSKNYFDTLIPKYTESSTQSQISAFRAKLNGCTNKHLTPFLLFDILFGTLSKKSGTTIEKKIDKFYMWLKRLSEKENKFDYRSGDLTELYTKFLNR